jgi:hypothetical protein
VDSPGIVALAKARAFKQELILTICTNNHLTHCLQVRGPHGAAGRARPVPAPALPARSTPRHAAVDLALAGRLPQPAAPAPAAAPPPQWYQNMRSMGYGHTVVLTEGHNSSDCDTLRKVEPALGCAWDSTQLPPIEEFAGGRRSRAGAAGTWGRRPAGARRTCAPRSLRPGGAAAPGPGLLSAPPARPQRP